MRRKADLEDMVVKSETRLKELLGSNALQVACSMPSVYIIRMKIHAMVVFKHFF